MSNHLDKLNQNLLFISGYNKESDLFRIIDNNPQVPTKKWKSRNQIIENEQFHLLEMDEFINPLNHIKISNKTLVKLKEIKEKKERQEKEKRIMNPVFQKSLRLRSQQKETKDVPNVLLKSKFISDPKKLFLPEYMVDKEEAKKRVKLDNFKTLSFEENSLIDNYLEEKQTLQAIELMSLFILDYQYYPKASIIYKIINQTIQQLKSLIDSPSIEIDHIPRIKEKATFSTENEQYEIEYIELMNLKKENEIIEIENKKINDCIKLIFKLIELLKQLLNYLDPKYLIEIFKEEDIESIRMKKTKKLRMNLRSNKITFWEWIKVFSQIQNHQQLNQNRKLVSLIYLNYIISNNK
ncbi:hypothetical protein K502DRAFT_322979 [Neoconidiobolus thromboides FSU 785]|nr:hypothetical protein K502DRAFT_322979 [Neoconidiobolus thromboides FSU 785]